MGRREPGLGWSQRRDRGLRWDRGLRRGWAGLRVYGGLVLGAGLGAGGGGAGLGPILRGWGGGGGRAGLGAGLQRSSGVGLVGGARAVSMPGQCRPHICVALRTEGPQSRTPAQGHSRWAVRQEARYAKPHLRGGPQPLGALSPPTWPA